MKISRLQVQNFKSFDTVDVELGDFNVLIGANASGKSNFLSILTFLRDIARDGLKDAVSMQSGEIELLRNVQIRGTRQTKISIEGGSGLGDPGRPPDHRWEVGLGRERMNPSGFRYEIGLQHEASDYRISTEKVRWAGYITDLENESSPPVFEKRSDTRASPAADEDSASLSGTPAPPSEDSKTSLLQKESESAWAIFTREILSQLRVFHFGTAWSGSGSSPRKGKAQLEEDGSNTALVLRNLLKDEENRRKLLNLAGVLLPFVEDVNVDRFPGQSLLVELQESHSGERYLPASLLSEGTIKVIALVIALYFENKRVMAFEEPAISLHPKLISQLMQMMKEVSEEKQIFVTTHNPEVIRHVELENLYLVSRDEDGFSKITKPGDSEIVHSFLENELGIDDLFVDDLLSL